VPVAVVLVISSNRVIADLLGELVRVSGFVPVHSEKGEPALEALRRLAPDRALVDCEPECGIGDEFVRGADALGTRVVLYGASAHNDEVRGRARALGVRWLPMPARLHDVVAALQGAPTAEARAVT
jgi:DNA-binding response OmpR family regulator